MPSSGILNIAAIRACKARHEPYTYFMGDGVIAPQAFSDLGASFPKITATGFHPAEDMEFHGAFAQLIGEIQGPEFVSAVSDALGVDLTPYPQLITIRRVSAAHEGRIHSDSESKIATCLIYMNEGWLPPEGRFRVLRNNKSFGDYVVEASPEMGSIVAFRRADNSARAYTFVGERRVVQIAWVRSQADIDRKKTPPPLRLFQEPVQGRKAEAY